MMLFTFVLLQFTCVNSQCVYIGTLKFTFIVILEIRFVNYLPEVLL